VLDYVLSYLSRQVDKFSNLSMLRKSLHYMRSIGCAVHSLQAG
jgi:hypothetical protein